MQSKFIFSLVIICFAGLALAEEEIEKEEAPMRCIVCNSKEQADCEGASLEKYAEDCPANKFTNEPAVVCRKIHMYLDESYSASNQEGERIIRQCGYKDDSNLHRSGTCYYRSGYSTRTWTCSCEGNECNTASLPVTSSALLATAALALVARFAAA